MRGTSRTGCFCCIPGPQRRQARARAAAIAGASIILEGYRSGELGLSKRQLEKLYRMIRDLESLPDDSDAFMESCLKRYSAEVSKFDPANYGL